MRHFVFKFDIVMVTLTKAVGVIFTRAERKIACLYVAGARIGFNEYCDNLINWKEKIKKTNKNDCICCKKWIYYAWRC